VIRVLVIVGGVLAAVGLMIFLLMRKLRTLADAAEAELRADLEAADVLLSERSANSFGVQSQGVTQVRGNGVLLLTPRELRFRMWAPARRQDIPLNRIVGTEVARSHLGKTKGRPLLKVRFTNGQGADDSVAFLVGRGPKAWIEAIDTARKESKA